MTRDIYMSERDEFMATIKRMWINTGRSENSWDAVHDWQYYFMVCGYRADGAVESFNDALQCE